MGALILAIFICTLPSTAVATSLDSKTTKSHHADFAAEARALKINLSKEIECHLMRVIEKKRGEQWQIDNLESIQESILAPNPLITRCMRQF